MQHDGTDDSSAATSKDSVDPRPGALTHAQRVESSASSSTASSAAPVQTSPPARQLTPRQREQLAALNARKEKARGEGEVNSTSGSSFSDLDGKCFVGWKVGYVDGR